jgi:formylglycine-generating enzyme required for sulfatase activity
MAKQSPDSLGGQETFTGPLAKPTGPLNLAVALATLRNTIGMSFKLIPAGEFIMMGSRELEAGSPESEAGRDADEAQRAVKIPSAFWIGVYEVTQSQYKSVMGSNPSHFKGANKPVDSVSWSDAVAFCVRLSSLPAEVAAGRVYRLPTEAEWEYACRAGTTTAYSFGDDAQDLGKYAWFGDNSGSTTHAVGKKLPNGWGLYDMHGNVWEWCSDAVVDGSFRVRRGGGWYVVAADCRAADRSGIAPSSRDFILGFRLALSSPSGESPEAAQDK